ncbi:MAG: hypothetical protein IPI67_29270 [Myxococcales bacterium]|nr:hypothetical protein [Myxococcales bacterium]
MPAAQHTGEVKGYALLSYVAPLQRDKGDLWHRVELAMSPEAQRFFRGEIYASSWYPRAHLHALMQAYCQAVKSSNDELRELGSMAARYQIHVIYRLFLKFATPALVFNRASSVWSRQTTVGTFTVVEEHPDHLIGELDDPDLPKGIPELISGWSDTIIAMLGRTPYRTSWEAVGPTRWRFRVGWIKR